MKDIDLTAKIKINDTFIITVGRLLFVTLVTFIQFLAIIASTGWIITVPSIIIWSNMLLSLAKNYDKKEDKPKIEEKTEKEKDQL